MRESNNPMEFKTELHAHTAEVSPCAGFTAARVVEKYLEAGFSTLVITDHFRDYVIEHAGLTWHQKIDHYLAGYRNAVKHANDQINVLLGIELQFVGERNDYLIYGITEDFLYSTPDIHKMSLKSLRSILPPTAMIVHAHPFRSGATITDPALLDGMEAYNGGTSSTQNAFAEQWAERFDLIPTSGSDYHGGPASRISGGIVTDEEIVDCTQLTQILRSRAHTLIRKGSCE